MLKKSHRSRSPSDWFAFAVRLVRVRRPIGSRSPSNQTMNANDDFITFDNTISFTKQL